MSTFLSIENDSGDFKFGGIWFGAARAVTRRGRLQPAR